MWGKSIALALIGAYALLLLASCTSMTGAVRTNTGEECEAVRRLASPADETAELLCAHEIHAAPVGLVDANPRPFELSYLEFQENGPSNAFASQKADLARRLEANPRNYVVVFIHGWRNNASRDSKSIRNFRILLAYANSFVEQRCRAGKREFCHTKVTGLFVGWRGAIFASDKLPYLAAETAGFYGRKSQSELLAPTLIKTLGELQAAARVGPGINDGRMLVVGHSFGGNMLATGLLERAKSWFEAHQPGMLFPSPLGTLTVLINPAAEARKWTEIQHEVRARTGRRIGDTGPTESFESYFPIDQKPVYVSLTSMCEHFPSERGSGRSKGRDFECDNPTRWYFPIASILAGRWPAEERETIGHLFPDYPAEGKDRSSPGTRFVGLSHELDINYRASHDRSTTWEHGWSLNASRCDVVDGWLLAARQRQAVKYKGRPAGIAGRSWDAGLTENGKPGSPPNILPIDRAAGLEAQFRHGLERQARLSVVPAASPFWNVRAHASVMHDHSRYISYQVWCAINQLALDDVTAQR